MVYKWTHPDIRSILERFRELAIRDGLPGLFFTLGLPGGTTHEDLNSGGDKLFKDIIAEKKARKFAPRDIFDTFNTTTVYPYPRPKMVPMNAFAVPDWCRRQPSDKDRYPQLAGVLTSFDNTPRRGLQEAWLWGSDTPPNVIKRFRSWLHAAVYYEACCFAQPVADDRFVLVNAWNEWGEGMAMEPSDMFQYGFLEAVRDVKAQVAASGCQWKE